MRILVLNGSPKEVSDTMTLTSAFLKGLNKNQMHQIEEIRVIDKNIQYCRGDLSCWIRQDGHCIIEDDMNMLLDKVTKSDVVVWSFPLYEYGIPAPMKAFIDRTNPFLKMQMKVENERVVHDTVVDMTKKKNIVICGCGFPYFEDNFSAVRIQMKNMFFNPLMLCIFEAGLVNIDNSQLAPMKEHLLDALRKAGEEYDQTGTLSDETREIIETPLLSTDAYIGIINSLVG